MSEIFRIPSDRQPLDLDGKVLISRPWFLFLQALFVRSGGSAGTPVEDLDIALASDTADADQTAVFMSQIQSLDVRPEIQALEQQNQFLEGELAATRERLTALEQIIQGMQSGNIIL